MLGDLLQKSTTSFSSDTLTTRVVVALAATQRWLAEEPSSPTRQRIALRTAMMLVATVYEWIGTAAADAMTIQLDAVPAPETKAHRDAIRGAAAFAAHLIADAGASALDELGQSYAALLRRSAGVSPAIMGDLPAWHLRALRAAVAIVRAALLAHWDRIPITGRLRVLQTDANRRVATRAIAHPATERLSVLHGVTPAGKRRSREWSKLLNRAREIGREIGPDQALDSALEAVHTATEDMRGAGVSSLLVGAGEDATRPRGDAAIARIRHDDQLGRFLGPLLAGLVSGPGVAPDTLRALAADDETASHLAQVLDLVAEDEEQQLIEDLMRQPNAHPWRADHLGTCRRLGAAARTELLLELAEAGDDAHLAGVLEHFGVLDGSLRVASDLRPRLLQQMVRVAGVAALGRGETADLGDVYSLVVSWDSDDWLDVIAARRQTMLTSPADDRRLWDLIPDDFTTGLNELSPARRDATLPANRRLAG